VVTVDQVVAVENNVMIVAPELALHVLERQIDLVLDDQNTVEGYVFSQGVTITAALVIVRDKPHDVDVHFWTRSRMVLRPHLIRRVFDIFFDDPVVARVTAEISEKNEVAARFAEKMGFVFEGIKYNGMRNGDHKLFFGLLKTKVTNDA